MPTLDDLEEYARFFNSVEIPKVLRIDTGSVANDVPGLINNHLTVLHEKGNLPVYAPYWQRLEVIKRLLLEDPNTVARKY